MKFKLYNEEKRLVLEDDSGQEIDVWVFEYCQERSFMMQITRGFWEIYHIYFDMFGEFYIENHKIEKEFPFWRQDFVLKYAMIDSELIMEVNKNEMF